ncbi:MAG: RsmB/NOP family class I SAM-dependent RNA methyltransferase [Sulfolobales archaeon]
MPHHDTIASFLARILYDVERYSISLEKAFVRSCRELECPRNAEERERLYQLAKDFIKNIIRIRCIYGSKVSRKEIARLYLRGGWKEEQDLESWCLHSLPKWFYEKIRNLVGSEEAEKIFTSMNERIFWIRLNTLKAPEEKIIRSLEEDGVEIVRDKDLWYLYRIVKSRKPLRSVRAVKEFLAIPQDKASCLVVEALKPEKNDRILDMSAAPGIKTSLIAMLTDDQALIQAQDISRKRVHIMKDLMRRFGVKRSVDIILSDSRYTPSREKIFDKILLDAPCTSSGALWKDPGIRLSLLREDKIRYYSSIQKDLLREALKLGREIVYATCSILPEEGELVVSEIIDRSGDSIQLEKPLKNLSPGYRAYDPREIFARTFPHKDLSEGFFIAKLIIR